MTLSTSNNNNTFFTVNTRLTENEFKNIENRFCENDINYKLKVFEYKFKQICFS